jgi:multicomponent Na+:H+ antiporter subunit D
MVIGILGAIAQTDIRRILSFTLVSHIGYLVFGIALGTAAGLAGAIFYVVHHIAIQTTLFLVAGLVERQGGSTGVDRLGGLATASPVLAVLFFVPAMNLAGVPPFSGFIGKLGLLEAGVDVGSWLPLTLVAGGVITSLLTLVAISRVWSRAFWRPAAQPPRDDTNVAAAADAGPERTAPPPDDQDVEGHEAHHDAAGAWVSGDGSRASARRAAWQRHTAVATATTPATDGLGTPSDPERPERPLPRVMVGAAAAMVVLTVSLTALAGPLYGITDRASTDLLDRGPYLTAVFGGAEDVP